LSVWLVRGIAAIAVNIIADLEQALGAA